MAVRIKPEDLGERISCFGEFDRTDSVCLLHCGLNFECAACRERLLSLEFSEDELPVINHAHMV
ncbi:MAG: hypothetical protein LBJ14_00825 [Desulfarculales bacterium]|nr:hypothetical protein [Desulfarculales bacterium]